MRTLVTCTRVPVYIGRSLYRARPPLGEASSNTIYKIAEWAKPLLCNRMGEAPHPYSAGRSPSTTVVLLVWLLARNGIERTLEIPATRDKVP